MKTETTYVMTNTRQVFEIKINPKKAQIQKKCLYSKMMAVVPPLLGRLVPDKEIESALITLLVVYFEAYRGSRDNALYILYLIGSIQMAIAPPQGTATVRMSEALAHKFAELWKTPDSLEKARNVQALARENIDFHLPD